MTKLAMLAEIEPADVPAAGDGRAPLFFINVWGGVTALLCAVWWCFCMAVFCSVVCELTSNAAAAAKKRVWHTRPHGVGVVMMMN